MKRTLHIPPKIVNLYYPSLEGEIVDAILLEDGFVKIFLMKQDSQYVEPVDVIVTLTWEIQEMDEYAFIYFQNGDLKLTISDESFSESGDLGLIDIKAVTEVKTCSFIIGAGKYMKNHPDQEIFRRVFNAITDQSITLDNMPDSWMLFPRMPQSDFFKAISMHKRIAYLYQNLEPVSLQNGDMGWKTIEE